MSNGSWAWGNLSPRSAAPTTASSPAKLPRPAETPEERSRRATSEMLMDGTFNHIENAGWAGVAAQVANGLAYRHKFGPMERPTPFGGIRRLFGGDGQ
jgi:hypothetical protein